jgi:hypothetical protein
MHFDLLRGRIGVEEPNEPSAVFLLATRPPLATQLAWYLSEEFSFSFEEYPDSTELAFNGKIAREQAVEIVRATLEGRGHTVRLLEREVELDAKVSAEYSLFEEGMILH